MNPEHREALDQTIEEIKKGREWLEVPTIEAFVKNFALRGLDAHTQPGLDIIETFWQKLGEIENLKHSQATR